MANRFHPKGYRRPYDDIKCPHCGTKNKYNAKLCKKCLGILKSGWHISGIG